MTEGAVELLLRDPGSTGLFLDFDGTLSEIVDHPDAARPVEGVPELLMELARRYMCVAVVSGRSAHQLLRWLGPGVEIWGLHGAERTEGGRVVLSGEAARYESAMQAIADEARSELDDDGLEVENKGVMLGLHYRRAGDHEGARRKVELVAQQLADRHNLKVGHGRMVVELRPPIEFTKAEVVRRRIGELGLRAAAFVGDDIVDLPAFDALDEFENEGLNAVKVAVNSVEAPPQLIERADLTVDGPRGVVELLRSLLV